MKQSGNLESHDKRRRAILAAALNCFLQFGYAKTSMDDVAREANLSRPLLYLKFKNKEDLYIGVIDYLTEGRVEAAEKIVQSDEPAKSKLLMVYEKFILEPREKIIGKPMTVDFYKVYHNLFDHLGEKFRQQRLEYTQRVLGDRETAQVFMLAVEGLKSDVPDTNTLRARLILLIEKFVS